MMKDKEWGVHSTRIFCVTPRGQRGGEKRVEDCPSKRQAPPVKASSTGKKGRRERWWHKEKHFGQVQSLLASKGQAGRCGNQGRGTGLIARGRKTTRGRGYGRCRGSKPGFPLLPTNCRSPLLLLCAGLTSRRYRA